MPLTDKQAKTDDVTELDASELDASVLESVPPPNLPPPVTVPPRRGAPVVPPKVIAPPQIPMATPRRRSIPPKPRTEPPVLGAWPAAAERARRECEARAALEPTRAALLAVMQGRIQVHVLEDVVAAEKSLARAAELAPDARFVAHTRRVLSERGGYPDVVLRNVRTELAYVGDPRERAALLWQAAAIESLVTKDSDAAKKTLNELLTLEPTNIAAWDMLGALHLVTKAVDDGWGAKPEVNATVLVDSLGAIAQATDDALIKSAMFGAIGALRDRYLDDADAVGALKRALECDPTNVGAEATLARILLKKRAWDEYGKAVLAEADRTSEPLSARDAYERAGDVFAECLSDPKRAAAAWERAAELAEADPGPLEKLAGLHEGAGAWDQAVAAYERLVLRQRDPVTKAWTLVRLGNVLEKRQGRIEEAHATFKKAVDASSTFAPAVQALLRSSRALGLQGLVVELERRQADRLADPGARAARYASLAELVETTETGGEEIPLIYERALSLDPANAAAFDALDRVHRRANDWPRLITLYETALGRPLDPRRAAALKLELAELLHTRAGQPERAAAILREIVRQPEERYRTLMALARAYADTGQWADYVDALEAQASLLQGADEIAAVYRIGAALETRVKDLKRALAAYEIVLDRAPGHELAARAVVRIHEIEGRWERVIDGERRLLELLSRPEDVVECLMRIARVYDGELGRVGEAVIAYEEALKHTPSHAPAIAAIERLLRGVGEYARLAQMLARFARATPDPVAKTRAFLRAAMIFELHVNDSEAASAIYADLANDLGARFAALSGLVRLQQVRGDWEGVDRTLDALHEMTTAPAARVRLLVRLARNAELNLGNMTRAGRLLDDALALGGEPAALAVDRLRVARQEKNAEDTAKALVALAGATTDARLDAGLQHELAITAEYLGDTERASGIYERLAVRSSDDRRALDGLARCAMEGQLAPALLARARTVTDASLRAVLAFTAGMIDETAEVSDTTAAAQAYEVALEADPELLPVLDAARRLRAEASDWEGVAALGARAGRAAANGENAAEAWLATADVEEKHIGDGSRALASYMALLEGQPGNVTALDRALPLLETMEEGYERAAQLLRAHAEAVTEPQLKIRAYTRRATILASRLGDTAGAIIDLRRVLELARADDDVIGTMQALALLEERAQHWQEALALHERVTREPTADAAAKRRARLARARIFGESLKDDPSCGAILEELLREDAGDREAAQRLAEVAARTGKEAKALEIYEHLASSGSSLERIDVLAALAALQTSRSDQWTAADVEGTWARAFDLALGDPDVLPALETRIERDRDISVFASLAEAAVSRVPPNTPGVLVLRTTLARVLRDRLMKADAADRHLASAIQAFPDSMPTRLALAAALVGRNDEQAIAELRRAIEKDPSAPGPFDLLAKAARGIKRTNTGAMLATASAVLGGPKPTAETETTLAQLRPVADALPPQEAMARLGGPSRTWFLRNVLALIDPWLHKIFPGADALVEQRGRLPDSYPIMSDVRAIASALGVPPPTVCRGTGRAVEMLLTEQRAIVIGGDLLTDAGRPIALFHIAYASARVAALGSIYAAPREQVLPLLEAAIHPDADGPGVRDLRKRISSALPRKSKKELERIVAEGGGDLHKDLPIWAAEESRRALFAATLFCRDLRAVAAVLAEAAMAMPRIEDRRRALVGNQGFREALEFVASSAGFDAFQRIYGRP